MFDFMQQGADHDIRVPRELCFRITLAVPWCLTFCAALHEESNTPINSLEGSYNRRRSIACLTSSHWPITAFSNMSFGCCAPWPRGTTFKAVLKCKHCSDSCRSDFPHEEHWPFLVVAYRLIQLWLICKVIICHLQMALNFVNYSNM